MTRLLFSTVSCIVYAAQLFSQQKPGGSVEWPAYGNDAGGSRYSPLQQINEHNITRLRPTWIFRTGELDVYKGTDAADDAAFEATPIMVDGTLYFSTPSARVFALDAATGKRKWLFDAKIDLGKGYSEITSRGVSIWPAANEQLPANKDGRRIFVGTIDGRLIALDAATGQPVRSFGVDGAINLNDSSGPQISITSPPAIIKNLVIVGSSMGDNQRIDYPRGTVRAFDAVTGRPVWTWDPIPQDSADKAWYTWETPSAHSARAANAWSVISADPVRDLVFIPTSCPSTDYYGGQRPGSNLYANSVVALKASTGEMVWHFQTVHHDIWDYDIAAQPMLVDITKDNRKVPAVAVGTKMGHIFILHRETGKPLFPVVEKPVPASTVPGERAHATQPVPVLPKPLGLHELTPEHAWGRTPAEKKLAQQRMARYRYEGVFTPPSVQGSLIAPGNVGGIHWGGMCFDARNEVLVTNINWLAAIIRLVPREKLNVPDDNDENSLRAETGSQEGTPYVLKREYLFQVDSAQWIMQTTPPWGTLNAIDLKTGRDKWQAPLGYMLDPEKYPEAKKWGSLNLGGAIVTAGNLLFIAATRDDTFRAFQTSTGKLLWEYSLPASAQATPMSYSINGRQYVVIAAGGHGKFDTKQGDYLIAFSLGSTPAPTSAKR